MTEMASVGLWPSWSLMARVLLVYPSAIYIDTGIDSSSVARATIASAALDTAIASSIARSEAEADEI